MYFQNEPSANPLRLLVNSRVGGVYVSQPKKCFYNITPTEQQQQQWSQPPCDWSCEDKTAFLQISVIPHQSNS